MSVGATRNAAVVLELRMGVADSHSERTRTPTTERSPRTHASDLEKQATRPGANLLQQAEFEAFLEKFNNERPYGVSGLDNPILAVRVGFECHRC